jgi:hypothetical protein
VSTDPTPDDCRGARDAAGWVTSVREVFYLHGRVLVARATKDGRPSRGVAWRLVHE